MLFVTSLHLTLPFLRVTPPFRWFPIPKHQHLHHREAFHQLPWTHLVLHHSVHGPMQMIKSWWAWNRTQSPVLRGSRSVPDSIAIPRYASWDGASWNKLLGLLTHRVEQTHPSTMRRMNKSVSCNVIAWKDVSLPACSVDQFQLLSFSFLWLSLFSFPSCCLFVFSSCPLSLPQQLWLIHHLTLEPFLNVLVHVTIICGNVLNPNNGDELMTQTLQQLQHLNFGKYWWLWISSRFVHSWPRFIVTSWNQQHVRSHHLWIGWRNEPCSPTMYFSILIALHPSRCTTFFIASASTSGTRGITTCLLRPWTLDGKMRPAIHSLFETNFDLLTFYMTFDLTGSKVKIAACFFWLIPAHLGLTWSLSSCAWVAMRPCPIATCFLKLEKFLAFRVLELSFLVLASLLLLTCSII